MTQIRLGQIAQSGASLGDVATWDGSAWNPAAPTGGGGTGDASWTAVTFQNSWADFGSLNAHGKFRKDGQGFVHLSGLITGGSAGSIAFTLPAGYRPATNEEPILVARNSSGTTYVQIHADGTVEIGSTGWVSLDGLSFYV